ncbi:pyruvate dehydrogenase [Agromyces badenianii]|uniref:Pyruvate dehydrogenase n=1 Tax=Agromyces badenianii TaxID=2080742 RepID=A0A2S0WV99_9MICO|nr:pyruvate dehydrogenase [Agromyces badenianii]AWB95276.1 pyruvate dehydrogenase [Agromyces badenianii]
MARTIADQLVDQLIDAGVDHIYGIVGDSLNPIVDAVRRSGGAAKGGIDWIHVRHEESAAFMAAAEAQLTGKLAVCAGSCGPGNLHLVNGLYDAHRSGAPVLAIASHIPSAQIGSGYFQETHPERLFVECSNYCEQIMTAAQSPRVVNSALRHSITGPGVSVIIMPGDVAGFDASESFPSLVLTEPATLVPAEADVRRLAEAIDAAETVAIFAGAGVEGAHDEVVAFAQLLKAPIGHTLRGKQWIQYNNPFDVGMTGLLGYGAAHAGIHDADLLLLVGTDFPYEQFLPDPAQVVIGQIDADAAHLGRRVSVAHPVHGDVRATIARLTELVAPKTDRAFLDRMLKKHRKLLDSVVGTYADVSATEPIHPEYAISLIDQAAAHDAVFTADTGMGNVWQARYVTPGPDRRIIGSFIHGSMANAVPHAIGAQFAEPHRQVVAIAGDGGLSMLLGELITAATYKLPIKVFVFNNSSLGLVKLEMLVDGFPSFGVDVPGVDYAGIAEAIGFRAERVDHPRALEDAVATALSHDGPALLDIVTDPRALSLPPAITGDQVKGFALAMSKTVLHGGAAEAVAMARSNIRHLPGL